MKKLTREQKIRNDIKLEDIFCMKINREMNELLRELNEPVTNFENKQDVREKLRELRRQFNMHVDEIKRLNKKLSEIKLQNQVKISY